MKENTHNRYNFCNTLQKNMADAQSSRRDEIDVLRTAFWFAEIKFRLKASTAYEVERILEPEAFGKNKDGDPIHRNKWSKYEVGQHVPSNALVTQVDAKLSGTKRLLNHALWKALQAKPGVNENIDDWLRQLAPDIQKVVFHEDSRTLGNGSRRVSLSKRELKMLERRAGIDALACLTIFIREFPKQGEQAQILDLGASLYRVLLILCVTLPIGDFALELLRVYRERVFSRVRADGLSFHLEESDFVSAVGLLHVLLLSLEDTEQIGVTRNDGIQAMCKLLEGGYGFDIKFALDPLIGPVGPLTDANNKSYRDFERKKRFRKWGTEQIFSKTREVLPPKELW